jgi:hypothetical protein
MKTEQHKVPNADGVACGPVQFQTWLLFLITATSAAGAGAAAWLLQTPSDELGQVVRNLAIAMAASPLLYFFIPRRWLAAPITLFCAWLPWPVVPFVVGIKLFTNDSVVELPAFLLVAASFLTNFTPTIAVGVRRTWLQWGVR